MIKVIASRRLEDGQRIEQAVLLGGYDRLTPKAARAALEVAFGNSSSGEVWHYPSAEHPGYGYRVYPATYRMVGTPPEKPIPAGENVWENADGQRIVADEPPDDGWFPAIPHKRLFPRLRSYLAYPGVTPWQREANSRMAKLTLAEYERRAL